MLVLETRAFTQRLTRLLSDDEYRRLQLALVADPLAGDLIPGTGGIRKLRWGSRGRGKRGALRVLYYFEPSRRRLLMLFVFEKNERADLTVKERAALRKIVEREYR
jgi:hypothetical protein